MNGSDAGEHRSGEERLRRALEARRGTPFADDEWEEAKRNLVGVFLALGIEGATPAGEDSEPEP